MNTEIKTALPSTYNPEKHIPHSPEVEDEIIRRLIHDVVVPKPAPLELPKE